VGQGNHRGVSTIIYGNFCLQSLLHVHGITNLLKKSTIVNCCILCPSVFLSRLSLVCLLFVVLSVRGCVFEWFFEIFSSWRCCGQKQIHWIRWLIYDVMCSEHFQLGASVGCISWVHHTVVGCISYCASEILSLYLILETLATTVVLLFVSLRSCITPFFSNHFFITPLEIWKINPMTRTQWHKRNDTNNNTLYSRVCFSYLRSYTYMIWFHSQPKLIFQVG